MLNWINFLHIYQPPRQNERVFQKVVQESYLEIAKFFDLYDGVRLTMNASGSLLEQLIEYRYDELLGDFRKAFDAGEIELAGSAMYHPILPLLPDGEIERQILLDEKIKREIFGTGYKRRGFYLPEMAYSRRVGEILDKMGFEWIILDEISYDGRLDSLDKEKVYRIKGLKLKVVFRDRKISDSFVPEKIKNISKELRGKDCNIITATDGEIYGHHHKDFYAKTREVFTDASIRSMKVSQLMETFADSDLKEADPIPSNWESTREELEKNIPFSYWSHPDNILQKKLWDFAAFVIAQVEDCRQDKQYDIARASLDKGLSSCHFWAASGKKSTVWKETIWNPDMIESGSLFLVRALRSLTDLDKSARMEGEKRFLEITRLIWQLHWSEFYDSHAVEEK